ncbi:hypothetical protein ACFLT4_02755 [Chloroflexota bacterium]
MVPFDRADELFHFDYAYKLANGHGFINIYEDPISQDVFDAAKQLGYWKKLGLATPEEVGKLTPELLESINDWYKWDISGGSSYEGVQPPLYYSVCALFLKVLPIKDTISQAYICRLVSIVLAVLLLLTIYKFAITVTGSKFIAICSVLLLAVAPCESFISMRISNDIASQLMIALLLLTLARYIRKRNEQLSLKSCLFLGILVGLAGLTKLTALIVSLILILAYLLLLNNSYLLNKIKAYSIIAALGLGLSGWWYVRNFLLYGDWAGGKAIVEAIYVTKPTLANIGTISLQYTELLKQLIFLPYYDFYLSIPHWFTLNIWILGMSFMLTRLAADLPVRFLKTDLRITVIIFYLVVAVAVRHIDVFILLAPLIIMLMVRERAIPSNLSRPMSTLFLASLVPAVVSAIAFGFSVGPPSERYILVFVAAGVVYLSYSVRSLVKLNWSIGLLSFTIIAFLVDSSIHNYLLNLTYASRLGQ